MPALPLSLVQPRAKMDRSRWMIRLPTRVASKLIELLASSEKVIQLLLPTLTRRSHAFGKLRKQWAGFAPATPGQYRALWRRPRPVLCLFIVLCGRVL